MRFLRAKSQRSSYVGMSTNVLLIGDEIEALADAEDGDGVVNAATVEPRFGRGGVRSWRGQEHRSPWCSVSENRGTS